MNGQQLWRAVRREFKKQYPNGTIHRVENTLERGMSDVVWCAPYGVSGWIELKGLGDRETPLQGVFRTKWLMAGGNAKVLFVDDNPVGFTVLDATDLDWYQTLAEAITAIVGGQ